MTTSGHPYRAFSSDKNKKGFTNSWHFIITHPHIHSHIQTHTHTHTHTHVHRQCACMHTHSHTHIHTHMHTHTRMHTHTHTHTHTHAFMQSLNKKVFSYCRIILTSHAVMESAPAEAAIMDSSPVPVPMSNTRTLCPLLRSSSTALLMAR